MTASKKIELINLVKEEAKKLKELGKDFELERLSFDNLNPSSKSSCIYGQITGSCFSDRAEELIKSSCKRVYNRKRLTPEVEEDGLNGDPKESYRNDYWSPIEVFIALKGVNVNYNNKVLIDYLKGKRKTIRFK